MTSYRHGNLFAFDRGLALRLCVLYGALAMSTATVQQLGQDLAAWLGFARRGETVAITDQGRIVARLTPPDDTTAPAPVASRSMADWLAEQDQRMQRTFGNRIVADSAAVLNDQRADRE